MIRLVPIILILLLSACTATITTQVQPAQPWLDSGHTFRLRHDGLLDLRGKTIPMSGFLILDTQRDVAKLALLTGLGIKLATLEITPEGHTVLQSTPLASHIPHFLEKCAFTVRQIFLDGATFNTTPKTWTVKADGTYEIGTYTLPKKTVFTDHDAGYTVTLQLTGAEIR